MIGCGIISRHHLTAAARYRGATIIGVADRDINRARAQAQRFSVPRAFDNTSDLLALRPDVVHVLTPPDTHEAPVLEALAAGAHVYVEKPMAVAVEACEAMERAAARANRLLCVGHCMLYSPAMSQARELIASGAVGEIVQAAGAFNYDVRRNPSYGQAHWAKQLPGGLAEDLAVHPASLLIHLLGRPLRTVAASRTAAVIPDGKSAEVSALIEAERGLGTLSVSLRARPDMSFVDICGTRMMLRVNISSLALTAYRALPIHKTVARAVSNLDIAAQLIGGTAMMGWRLLRRKVDGSYGIVPLVHAFYAAVEAGRPAPIGAAEGAMAVGLLRAIWPIEQRPVQLAAAR